MFTIRLLFHLFFSHLILFAAAQSLEINFKNKENSTIILAHHFGDDVLNKKILSTDASGFYKDPNVHWESGLHYLIFKDSSFYEFFIEDTLSDVKIAGDFDGDLSISGDNSAEIYHKYVNQLKESVQEIDLLKSKKVKTNSSESIKNFERQINNSKNKINTFKDSIIATNRGTLIAKFFIAQRPPVIPKEIFSNELSSDSVLILRLAYYSKHYLDNLDISNQGLLNTPVYTEKINFYLDQVIPQKPKPLSEAIDFLIAQTSSENITKVFMINYLYNKLNHLKRQSTYEYAYLSLIDKHILSNKANGFTNDQIQQISSDYNQRKPSSIGQPAPSLILNDSEDKKVNLSHIEAENTVLLFYSTDCSICHKILPQIRSLIHKYHYLDIDVMAVCLTDSKSDFEDFIARHKISAWNNAYILNSEALLIKKYNLSLTPTIFILDKHKTIIYKNLTTNQLDKFLLKKATSK